MDQHVKILFLCTGNSCRSQMAEGWARHLKGGVIEAWSAGIETHGLNPNAVRVMAEAGVDISGHTSKNVADLMDIPFDYVVTVCGHAHETCPMFPGKARVVHVGFDDPPALAKLAAGEGEKLDCYRRVRDEIRAFVETLPESLNKQGYPMEDQSKEALRNEVRDRYAQIARSDGGCCGEKSSCCAPDSMNRPELSVNLGYSAEDCAAVPEGANMGLGCGNPRAIAALQPGETVLDLGSGGGFDCFLAAKQVGSSGRVIGVDMTPDMLGKARENARRGGWSNVEFRLGEIEHLPVADNSVDVIISNCVINLSPDKEQVFRETFRVLKPGGRLAIADVVMLRELPESLRGGSATYCGCVSGAVSVPELGRMLRAAGFTSVSVEVKEESREFIQEWFPGSGVESFVASAHIQAKKEGCSCCG